MCKNIGPPEFMSPAPGARACFMLFDGRSGEGLTGCQRHSLTADVSPCEGAERRARGSGAPAPPRPPAPPRREGPAAPPAPPRSARTALPPGPAAPALPGRAGGCGLVRERRAGRPIAARRTGGCGGSDQSTGAEERRARPPHLGPRLRPGNL